MAELSLMAVFVSFVTFIIVIVDLFKFFTLCNDIGQIRNMLIDFTKYYYKMQEYKISNKKD